MAFKTNSQDDDAVSDINITPLVDVMLVLVIILLITAPLLTQSIKVALPKTEQTASDNEKPPLQLAVTPTGAIRLNDKDITDLAELDTQLKQLLAINPDPIVHLYADHGVNYGKVAEVMAVANHAGIAKLAFVTIEQ